MFCFDNFLVYLKLVRPISAGIENDKHHLHIGEIEAYDIYGEQLVLNVDSYDSQKSSYPITKTIDGDYNTFGHTYYPEDTTKDHFLKYKVLSFNDVCLLGEVIIHNRNSCCQSRIVGSYLQVLRGSNVLFTFNIESTDLIYPFDIGSASSLSSVCSPTSFVLSLLIVFLIFLDRQMNRCFLQFWVILIFKLFFFICLFYHTCIQQT